MDSYKEEVLYFTLMKRSEKAEKGERDFPLSYS